MKNYLLTSIGAAIICLTLNSLWSFNAYTQESDIPIGTIIAYGAVNNELLARGGWLLCDGSDVAVSAYPRLASLLEKRWGPGKNLGGGNLYVTLPDLRGVFLRGSNLDLDKNAGQADETFRYPKPGAQTDAYWTIGTYQIDLTKEHMHDGGYHTHDTENHSHKYQDVVIAEDRGWGGNSRSISTDLGSGKTDRNNGYGYYITDITYSANVKVKGARSIRRSSNPNKENTVKNAAVTYYIKAI